MLLREPLKGNEFASIVGNEDNFFYSVCNNRMRRFETIEGVQSGARRKPEIANS